MAEWRRVRGAGCSATHISEFQGGWDVANDLRGVEQRMAPRVSQATHGAAGELKRAGAALRQRDDRPVAVEPHAPRPVRAENPVGLLRQRRLGSAHRDE